MVSKEIFIFIWKKWPEINQKLSRIYLFSFPDKIIPIIPISFKKFFAVMMVKVKMVKIENGWCQNRHYNINIIIYI